MAKRLKGGTVKNTNNEPQRVMAAALPVVITSFTKNQKSTGKLDAFISKYCESNNAGVSYHLKPNIIKYLSAAFSSVPTVNIAAAKGQFEAVCALSNKNAKSEEIDNVLAAAHSIAAQLEASLSGQTTNSVWQSMARSLPSILECCPSAQSFKKTVTAGVVDANLAQVQFEALCSAIATGLAARNYATDSRTFYHDAEKLYLQKFCGGRSAYADNTDNFCSVNVLAPVFALKLIEFIKEKASLEQWQAVVTEKNIAAQPKLIAIALAHVILEQEQIRETTAQYSSCQSELETQKILLNQCEDRVTKLKNFISKEALASIPEFVYAATNNAEAGRESKLDLGNLPPPSQRNGGGVYMEFVSYFADLLNYFGIESGFKQSFQHSTLMTHPVTAARNLVDVLLEAESTSNINAEYQQCKSELAAQLESVAHCGYFENEISSLIANYHDEL